MFVRNCMTTELVTTTAETSVLEALEVMNRHKVRCLPVVRGEKLQGLVSERELLRVAPSPASTLSIFEVNYLVSKMRVKEVMVKRPMATSPDTTIEEAALTMRKHKVSDLPVVEENKRLVGLITQTDLFDAMIELFGVRRSGVRLTLQVEDRVGILADLAQVIRQANVNIINVANWQNANGASEIVLRLDMEKSEAIVSMLTAAGFSVTHVT